MKKRVLCIALLFLLSAGVLWAVAAGGDTSDPLISLSYLNGTYASTVDTAVNTRLDASDAAITAAVTGTASSGNACAETWTQTRLKAADVLSGSAGLNVLVLAGSMNVTFASGAVVDATAGATISSGTTLTAQHRYLVAEDTSAAFTVTSKTAVVQYQGYYVLSKSNSVDYNAMASALKTMHLFKGSFTGYGEGFDLELAPTRLQALIMFIRVLGEEDAALAYTGETPFTDIAAGTDAAKYVGYAYSTGYSNGYTATTFKPGQTVNAYQYTEFMLRALGYSSVASTDLSGTLDKAVTNGVLTSGERSMLKTDPFLRAELVYISYYALDATVSGSGTTLRQALVSRGVFTSAEASAAAAVVSGSRLA